MLFVITDNGLVGWGAFDVTALEKFSYPSVKVSAKNSGSISNIENLVGGEVTLVNAVAAERGVLMGMSGEDAVRKLL